MVHEKNRHRWSLYRLCACDRTLFLTVSPFLLLYILFFGIPPIPLPRGEDPLLFQKPYFFRFENASTCINGTPYNSLLSTPADLKPFPSYPNLPLLDPHSRLLFCWIPKVACTQFKALFCRQFTDYDGGAGSTTSEMLFIHNVCFRRVPIFRPGSHGQSLFLDPKWERWAVVRDPIDRLISAWLDKCRTAELLKSPKRSCYGCGSKFDCFVKRNFESLTSLSRGKTSIGGLKVPHADHFYPQYWFCGFGGGHLQRYTKIFKFSKDPDFAAEVREAFRTLGNWSTSGLIDSGWGVDKRAPFLERGTVHGTGNKTRGKSKIPYNNADGSQKMVKNHLAVKGGPSKSLISEILSQNNLSKRRDRALRQLHESIGLTEIVYRTYLIDYESFNFQLPTWTIDLCRTYNKSMQAAMLVCHKPNEINTTTESINPDVK